MWAYTSLLHVPKTDTEKVLKNLSDFKTVGSILIGMIGNFEGEVEGRLARRETLLSILTEELTRMVTGAGFIVSRKVQTQF